MSKVFLISIFILSSLWSVEVPMEHVSKRNFYKTIRINSQIVQFANAKNSITTQISGRVIEYFVKVGEILEKGDKIAMIESIELSKLIGSLEQKQREFILFEKNYTISQKLYRTGVESKKQINKLNIQRDGLQSQIKSMSRELKLLGIENNSTTLTLYATQDGRIDEILIPLNRMVDKKTPILTISNHKELMLKSFIPLKYANSIDLGNSITIKVSNEILKGEVVQILPHIDSKTQQIVILSKLYPHNKRIFLDSFVESHLSLNPTKRHLAIKKTALSFMNSEWVVFVPIKEEHEDEKHDEHDEDDEHEDEKHDEHDEDKDILYESKIIKIITEDRDFFAIDGLREDEEYVSDKSYIVKSLLLKSSLGGHGH